MKTIGHLMKEVTIPEFCLSCGACVAGCCHNVLEMVDGKPKLVGRCELCSICYYQCPQVIGQKELEKKIFERNSTADEPVGIYTRAISGQTTDHKIRVHCQDGGFVTSLLSALLKAEFIDGAVVTASDEWRPVPKVATTRAELIECAGSKYSRGSLLLGLRDAIDLYSLEKIAIVGLPCQIKAIRRMQNSERTVHRLTDSVKLCIGLFCGMAFPYEKFFKSIVEGQLHIKLKEVSKFDVKGGSFLIYRKGKPRRELTLDALEQFVDVPCSLCSDFASELADISVGAVGSPLGHSTALLRTQVGGQAYRIAEDTKGINSRPIEEVKPGIEAIVRLSKSKKRRAKEEMRRRQKLNKPLPPWIQEQRTIE
jgi:coenzyme F420 hydrogenase subunit beta